MADKIINKYSSKGGIGSGPQHVAEPANNMVERLLNRIPGPRWVRVAAGTGLFLGFCGVTFFSGRKKQAGHGAFDVEKPEAVQRGQDSAEAARLERFGPKRK